MSVSGGFRGERDIILEQPIRVEDDPVDSDRDTPVPWREEPMPRLPWIELILGFVGTVFAIIMWAEFMK